MRIGTDLPDRPPMRIGSGYSYSPPQGPKEVDLEEYLDHYAYDLQQKGFLPMEVQQAREVMERTLNCRTEESINLEIENFKVTGLLHDIQVSKNIYRVESIKLNGNVIGMYRYHGNTIEFQSPLDCTFITHQDDDSTSHLQVRYTTPVKKISVRED